MLSWVHFELRLTLRPAAPRLVVLRVLTAMFGAVRRRDAGERRRKQHPLAARPLPLAAFAGDWPATATLDPARVSVYGSAVRARSRRARAAP